MDLTPGCLRHGKNSGYAAINLAVHMGAKRIILMGYDMNAKGCDVVNIDGSGSTVVQGRTHWHEGSAIEASMRVYNLMLPYFSTMVAGLDLLGVEVLNAGMGSKIDVFPKIPLGKAHIVSMLGAGQPV